MGNEGGITLSTEVKKPLRRIRRLSQWEQVGIEPKTKTVEKWTQDRTTVTNGDITLEVGSRITGYEANGISDWYVLGAEDGKLLITTKSCPEKVELRGRDGYTNGVEILNNVAKKYTNSIYADGNSRSINVDDVNRVTGYNPETAGYGANEPWQYGNEVTFYWDGTVFPYYSASNGVTGQFTWYHRLGFFYQTVSAWITSQKSITATESNKEEITKLTSTFYKYEGSHYLDENSDAYQLLFRGKSYWLGSSYVYCGSYYAEWGFHFVGRDGNVHNKSLADSKGSEDSDFFGVLPVVSLKPDIIIDTDGKIQK